MIPLAVMLAGGEWGGARISSLLDLADPGTARWESDSEVSSRPEATTIVPCRSSPPPPAGRDAGGMGALQAV